MKYSFKADYSEGSHPEILKYLTEVNEIQSDTYGHDEFCKLASDRIKETFGLPNANVQFLASGTLTNVTALCSMLKSYEGVIAPSSGHINVHETGAIEAAGHKIIYVDTVDGKLTPAHIEKAMLTYEDEHTVVPRVVYITQSTERATLYTKAEIEAVVASAKSHDLYVYVDGARLAQAFVSEKSDMTPKEFAQLGIDMFYIGGAKNGLLFGEALVVVNEKFSDDIRFYIKQRGGVLGKTRTIGAQFARDFDSDDLWLKTAKHSCDMAKKLYEGMSAQGVELDHECNVNQIFPILQKDAIEKLEELYGFYRYEEIDEKRQRIRLVTSWATPVERVEEFLLDLKNIL